MKECVILFTARSKIMNYVEEIEKINTKISEAKGATKTLNEQYEILLKEMTDIEKEIIDEQSRLRDLNVQLDLGAAQGAQQAAADAQEAKTAAEQAGYAGIVDTAQKGLNMLPLFAKQSGPITDFSPAGGQVTTSQGPNFKSNTSSAAMNPVGAQNNPSLMNDPWKPNPFMLGDFSSIGGLRR